MIGLHLRKRSILRDIGCAAAEHNKGRRLRGRLTNARKNLILPLVSNTLIAPDTGTQSAVDEHLPKLSYRTHRGVRN
jgi:hypothetical protein